MSEPKVIVSLTSHTKERLKNVPYFLYHSIFKHGYDYVKVVLTLWKDDIPLMPEELKMMIENGLVELIEAEQDLKCNLKYFYCMKKYRDLPIITIDDDSVYPKQMIPDLLANSEKYPNTIIGRSGVLIDKNKSYIHNVLVNVGVDRIFRWNGIQDKILDNLNLEGYGGILYPANILEVSDNMIPEMNEFTRADDIYLYIIEKRKNIDRIVPYYGYNKLEVCTKGFDAISTKSDNVKMIDSLIRKWC